MAKAFNLTAELNLRGPSNLKVVIADIKKQLSNISASVTIKLDPASINSTQKLTASLVNLNNALKTVSGSAASASAAISSFGNAVNKVNISHLPKTIASTATAIGGVSRSAQASATSLSHATSQMQKFGAQSGLALKRFAAFSAATTVVFGLTNAIKNGIQEFIAYDQQLIKIQQVTGQSAAGLEDLQKSIISLSTNLGVSSSELTSVALTLAQAGLSARDTEKALKALALSALAPSFDNMNETVEGSIALMRQFTISADELDKALGAVNAVSNKFAVEASDIITAIQRTGGVFATASRGVSEGTDALNEFIAVFTSVRATTRESAETIATGLRTIFTRIQRKDTIEALKEYGVNLTDLDGKFVGAYRAVELLSKGLSKIDTRDIKFSQIIEELGGFRQIGKVIPLIQQFAVAQDALKVAQSGQSSLAKDAATAQLSLANQIVKVREQFQSLFKSIGQSTAFQVMATGALSLAGGLIKIADSLKSILPLLGIVLAFKGLKAVAQYSMGFAGSVKQKKEEQERPSLEYARGGRVRKFASGGVVPGVGDSDSVPARLTPGEFVIRKSAVRAIGVNNLHTLNRNSGGPIQRFEVGGQVQRFASAGKVKQIPVGSGTHFTHLDAKLEPENFPPKLKRFMKKNGLNIKGIYSNMGLDLPGLWNRNWDLAPDENVVYKDRLASYVENKDVFSSLKKSNKIYRFHGRSDSPAAKVLNAVDRFGNGKDQKIRKKLAAKIRTASTPFYDTDKDQVIPILPSLLKQSIDTSLDIKDAESLIKGLEEKSAYKIGKQRKAIYSDNKKNNNVTAVRREHLLNSGGSVRKFADAGAVTATAGKTAGASEILRALGVASAAKAGGISTAEVYTILNKRKPSPEQLIVQQKIQAEFLKNTARLAGAEKNKTNRITSKGLVFGAAGMFGSPFAPVNKTIESDLLKSPVGVRIVSGVMKADTAQATEKIFNSSMNKAANKASKKIMVSDIIEKAGLGRELNLDFDKTLAFGAMPARDPNTPRFAEFGDRTKVAEALKGSKLSLLGKELSSLVSSRPELLENMKVITARPSSTLDLIQDWLSSKGLPIPLDQFKGLGGPDVSGSQIAKLKALLLSSGSLFVDDDARNIKASRARSKEGISSYRYGNRKNKTNLNADATAQGVLFEKVVEKLGGPSALKGQGVDFPQGLKGAAKYFGIPGNIPTDAKRTINGPSTVESNIVTYLKNVKGYALGGPIQRLMSGGFAKEGWARGMYSPEDVAKAGFTMDQVNDRDNSANQDYILDSYELLKKGLKPSLVPTSQISKEFAQAQSAQHAKLESAMERKGKKMYEHTREQGFNQRRFFSGGAIQKFGLGGEAYALEKASGLSSFEFDQAKKFADTAGYSMAEFQKYLVRTLENKKQKSGLKTDSGALLKSLMPKSTAMTAKQLSLAESLKGAPDAGYRPIPTSVERIASDRLDVHKATRGFASGGIVPGVGNGDTVPAVLDAGDFVIRKSSVKSIGTDKLASMARFASGGSADSSVPALLTPGEFVFPKQSAQKIGYSKLNTMNKLGRFNAGGSVGPVRLAAGGGVLGAIMQLLSDAPESGRVGGKMPVRPASINPDTIAVLADTIKSLDTLGGTLEKLGIKSSATSDLLQAGGDISYEAATKAYEADLQRMKVGGASLKQLAAAESTLIKMRQQGAAAAQKQSDLSNTLGAGDTQQAILSSAKKEEARLIAKAKSGKSGFDISNPESLLKIKEMSFKTATENATGSKVPANISGNDIERYIDQSKLDRKTLNEMDAQLINDKKQELQNTNEYRNSNKEQKAKLLAELEKTTNDEINTRRKLINQLAEESDRVGPGGNSATARALQQAFPTFTKGFDKFAGTNIGKVLVNKLGPYLKGSAGAATAAALIAANSNKIGQAAGYFGANERTTGGVEAGVNAGASTMASGFTTAAMIANPVVKGVVIVGSALMAYSNAIKAASLAMEDFDRKLLDKGLEESLSMASRAIKEFATDPTIARFETARATIKDSATKNTGRVEFNASKASGMSQRLKEDEYYDAFTGTAQKKGEGTLLTRGAQTLLGYDNSKKPSSKYFDSGSGQIIEKGWSNLLQRSGQAIGTVISSKLSGRKAVDTSNIGASELRDFAMKEAESPQAMASQASAEQFFQTSTSSGNINLQQDFGTEEGIKKNRDLIMDLSAADAGFIALQAVTKDMTAADKEFETKTYVAARAAQILADPINISAQRAHDLAKAMKDADDAGRQLSASFKSLIDTIGQSINAAEFEAEARKNSITASSEAMSGDARIQHVSSSEINTLQNPNVHSKAEVLAAQQTASGMLGGGPDRNMFQGGLEIANNLKGVAAQAIAAGSKANGAIDVDQAIKEAQRAGTEHIKNSSLPKDLQENAINQLESSLKAVGAKIEGMPAGSTDKQKVDTLFEEILHSTSDFATGLNKELSDTAISLLKFRQDAVNRFVDSVNKMSENAEMSARLTKKANDIRRQSSYDVREAISGVAPSFGEMATNQQQDIQNLTGGETDPNKIAANIIQLDATRKAQQKTVEESTKKLSTAQGMDAADPARAAAVNNATQQVDANAAALIKTTSQLNRNNEALKNLADNTQLAAKALSDLRDAKQRQQSNTDFMQSLLTKTPEEAKKLSEAFSRLQNNLAGGLNTGSGSRAASGAYQNAIRSGASNRQAANAGNEALAQERAGTQQALEQYNQRQEFNLKNEQATQIMDFRSKNKNATPEQEQQHLAGFQGGRLTDAKIQEQLQNNKAKVFAAQAYETGQQNNPAFIAAHNEIKDPTQNASVKLAAQNASRASENMAKANEAMAKLPTAINDLVLPIQELKASFDDFTASFKAAREKDTSIANPAPKLPVAPIKPAVAKNQGGMIYASTGGRLVNFEPKGEDKIPAMLSKGEFVVNATSTSKNLPLLKAINENKGGKIPGFNKGGVVYLAGGGLLPDTTIEADRHALSATVQTQGEAYFAGTSPEAIADQQQAQQLEQERQDAHLENYAVHDHNTPADQAAAYARDFNGGTSNYQASNERWQKLSPEEQKTETDAYQKKFEDVQNKNRERVKASPDYNPNAVTFSSNSEYKKIQQENADRAQTTKVAASDKQAEMRSKSNQFDGRYTYKTDDQKATDERLQKRETLENARQVVTGEKPAVGENKWVMIKGNVEPAPWGPGEKEAAMAERKAAALTTVNEAEKSLWLPLSGLAPAIAPKGLPPATMPGVHDIPGVWEGLSVSERAKATKENYRLQNKAKNEARTARLIQEGKTRDDKLVQDYMTEQNNNPDKHISMSEFADKHKLSDAARGKFETRALEARTAAFEARIKESSKETPKGQLTPEQLAAPGKKDSDKLSELEASRKNAQDTEAARKTWLEKLDSNEKSTAQAKKQAKLQAEIAEREDKDAEAIALASGVLPSQYIIPGTEQTLSQKIRDDWTRIADANLAKPDNTLVGDAGGREAYINTRVANEEARRIRAADKRVDDMQSGSRTRREANAAVDMAEVMMPRGSAAPAYDRAKVNAAVKAQTDKDTKENTFSSVNTYRDEQDKARRQLKILQRTEEVARNEIAQIDKAEKDSGVYGSVGRGVDQFWREFRVMGGADPSLMADQNQKYRQKYQQEADVAAKAVKLEQQQSSTSIYGHRSPGRLKNINTAAQKAAGYDKSYGTIAKTQEESYAYAADATTNTAIALASIPIGGSAATLSKAVVGGFAEGAITEVASAASKTYMGAETRSGSEIAWDALKSGTLGAATAGVFHGGAKLIGKGSVAEAAIATEQKAIKSTTPQATKLLDPMQESAKAFNEAQAIATTRGATQQASSQAMEKAVADKVKATREAIKSKYKAAFDAAEGNKAAQDAITLQAQRESGDAILRDTRGVVRAEHMKAYAQASAEDRPGILIVAQRQSQELLDKNRIRRISATPTNVSRQAAIEKAVADKVKATRDAVTSRHQEAFNAAKGDKARQAAITLEAQRESGDAILRDTRKIVRAEHMPAYGRANVTDRPAILTAAQRQSQELLDKNRIRRIPSKSKSAVSTPVTGPSQKDIAAAIAKNDAVVATKQRAKAAAAKAAQVIPSKPVAPPTKPASFPGLDEARANMERFRESGNGGEFQNYNGELLLSEDVDKLLGRMPAAKVTVDTPKAAQASAEKQVKLRAEARKIDQERIRSQEAKDAGKSVDDIMRESRQRLKAEKDTGNVVITAKYNDRTVMEVDLERLRAADRREMRIQRQVANEKEFIADTMYSGIDPKDTQAVKARTRELRDRAMSRGTVNGSPTTQPPVVAQTAAPTPRTTRAEQNVEIDMSYPEEVAISPYEPYVPNQKDIDAALSAKNAAAVRAQERAAAYDATKATRVTPAPAAPQRAAEAVTKATNPEKKQTLKGLLASSKKEVRYGNLPAVKSIDPKAAAILNNPKDLKAIQQAMIDKGLDPDSLRFMAAGFESLVYEDTVTGNVVKLARKSFEHPSISPKILKDLGVLNNPLSTTKAGAHTLSIEKRLDTHDINQADVDSVVQKLSKQGLYWPDAAIDNLGKDPATGKLLILDGQIMPKPKPGVQKLNKGGIVYASNGALMSHQSKGTDTQHIMATPGEFMVKEPEAKKNMPLLQAINSGSFSRGGMTQYLANGGIVAPRYYQNGSAGPVPSASQSYGGGVLSSGGMDLGSITDAIGQLQEAFGSINEMIPSLGEAANSFRGAFQTGGETIGGATRHLQESADSIGKMTPEVKITGNMSIAPLQVNGGKVFEQLGPGILAQSTKQMGDAFSRINRGVGNLGEGVFGSDSSQIMGNGSNPAGGTQTGMA